MHIISVCILTLQLYFVEWFYSSCSPAKHPWFLMSRMFLVLPLQSVILSIVQTRKPWTTDHNDMQMRAEVCDLILEKYLQCVVFILYSVMHKCPWSSTPRAKHRWGQKLFSQGVITLIICMPSMYWKLLWIKASAKKKEKKIKKKNKKNYKYIEPPILAVCFTFIK